MTPDDFPEIITETPLLTPPDLPRATYAEDDWIAEVVILEDLGTNETEAYKLRVVRTIQPSQLYVPVEDGTKFRCDQRRTGPHIFTLTRL